MSRKPLNRETTGIAAHTERIIQFGAGNFIRAFMDWMIQELNTQADFDAGVVIVKHITDRNTLDEQDGLYHVHTEGIQNGEFRTETQLVDCICRSVSPDNDHAEFLALARQPEIQLIISNTTEAGIQYVETDKATDTPPSSYPAKLTQLLYARYQESDGAPEKGCVIIPLELIEENGTQLRKIVLQYAEQWELDAAFIDWVQQHNVFCNTLVDRIVPGYPADKSDAILDAVGYDDKLLTMGEPFHKFIIEAPQKIQADFPTHKTSLNVKIVDDASPYRETKVRILNGLHTSMVPIGYLMGLETVRECVEHPQLGAFLQTEAYHEIIPSMDIDEDELKTFAEAVFDRFRNPSIHHELISIALNSSTKVRTRLLPSLLGYHAKFGALPPRLVLAIAAFIRMYKGTWQGKTIPLKDNPETLAWFAEQWETSTDTAELVRVVLANTNLWETDLNAVDGLHTELTHALNAINAGELAAHVAGLEKASS